jgi:hypothetical protein
LCLLLESGSHSKIQVYSDFVGYRCLQNIAYINYMMGEVIAKINRLTLLSQIAAV